MSDSQTIYEIRLAFKKPGCPICNLVQRAGARFIEGIFTESMLDPIVRQKLVNSNGFCYEHTWLSINLKLSDALGQAILYHDLIQNAIKKIDENRRFTNNQIVDAMELAAKCPACRIEMGTLERVIDSMAAALKDQSFIADFNRSSGLCNPHLERLLNALDEKQQTTVLRHQRDCLKYLNDELAEFIRKSDYRFRDEVIGKEGDSYKRAADLIKGKLRPAERKDLG